MANGRIKGITIELNGDATKLNKALESSEKSARESAKALKEIERNLKFNPGNSKLVEQQQRNLAQAIEATKEKLKVLKDADSQMKQQLSEGKISIDQYEAFQREIISTEGQLASYEKKLGSSQSEQEKLASATQGLSTIFEKSGTSIDDFAEILGEDTVEAFKKGEGSSQQMEGALQRLGDELLGTGGDSEKLSEDLERLGEGVSFDTLQAEARASGAEFGQLGKSADEADKEIEGINGNALQVVGLDAAIDLFGKLKDAAGKAIGAIMDAWGKLDAGQDTIIAKTGATGAAAEEMGQLFTDVYTSMPSDAQAVGDAIGELNTQFGLQGEALKSATENVLKYAEVNGSDVTQATQSAKAAMDQFGLSGKDLGSVLDIVTQAGQNTGVATEKLLDAVAQGAPTLQSLGLGFGESVVAMSQFEQSGINGSKALTYLTKAQSVAAKDGKSLQEALSEFSQVANSSASDTEKLNAATELFGTKGGAMMLKAAKEGHLNFQALKASAQDAGGTVENTYNAMLDPVDKLTVSQHNLDQILGEMGTTIQSAAAPAIDALAGFLQKLQAGFSSLSPEVQTAIVTIGGIVAAFLGIATAIATLQTAIGMVGPIIANVVGIFGGLGGAISGLFSFVAANPVVLIIAAIVAAVALLITHWDDVKKVAQVVWDKIVEVWNGIMAFLGPIMEAIESIIKGAWDGIKSASEAVWNGIKGVIEVVWNVIKTVVTTYIGIVKTVITTYFNVIKTIVTTIWNAIKAVIEGVWNGIKNGVSGAVNAVKTVVSSVFEGLKNTVSNIWNGIKNAIVTPIQKAKELIGGIIGRIGDIFHGLTRMIKLPHFSIKGKFSIMPPSIPKLSVDWYKQGGIFDRPSVIGVGEAGPEAVVPTNKLDAFFDAALKRVGGGKSPGDHQGSIIINVEKLEVRSDDDIRRIAEELDQLRRRELRARHV